MHRSFIQYISLTSYYMTVWSPRFIRPSNSADSIQAFQLCAIAGPTGSTWMPVHPSDMLYHRLQGSSTPGKRFHHKCQSTFWPFLLDQTMNRDFLSPVQRHRVLTVSTWTTFHLWEMLYYRCSLVALGTRTGTWSVLKYNFRVLVLVLVIGTRTCEKVLVANTKSFSAVIDTLWHLYSDTLECLNYWFLCPSFTIWHFLADMHFISFFDFQCLLNLR